MAFLAKQVTFVKGNVFVICADIHALLPTHFLTLLPSPLNSASQWGQTESEVSGKGGFFPESAIRFLDLQISKKKYSKKLS